MLGSSVLDIAIGLILVYTLLSIVCSAMTEMVAGLTAKRARLLHAGIVGMTGPQMADAVYEHALIRGLMSPEHRVFAWFHKCFGTTSRRFPSYIPADLFARALVASLCPQEQSLTSLKQQVASGDDATRASLRALLASDSIISLDGAYAIIASWFDMSMSRISGAYKRSADHTLTLLALVLAVGLNLDTIRIASALSDDTVLRASVVALATEASKQKITSTTGKSDDVALDFKAAITWATTVASDLHALRFPVGWSASVPSQTPVGLRAWLTRIFGWMVTVFAASLGAPFWFEILNRVANTRAAGKPPKVA